MPNTTNHITIDDDLTITTQDDVEFAVGAARYLRQAGLSNDAIAASLVNELGIDLTDAQNITLKL